MHRSSNSRSSKSSHNHTSSSSSGNGGIFSNLKKLTGGGNNSQANNADHTDVSSGKSINTAISNDNHIKPLSKQSTLNTQNLSTYTDLNSHYRSSSNLSSGSPTKYSYSRRASQWSSNGAGNGGAKLSRQQTTQSLSSASILSQGPLSNLSRFIAPDGSVRIERPRDPKEIEELFEDVLYKRNVLASTSQKDFKNYDIDKKWLIVRQDLQAEYKKLTTKKSTVKSPTSTVSLSSISSASPAHSHLSTSTGSLDSSAIYTGRPSISNATTLDNFYDGGHGNSSTATLSQDPLHLSPDYYVRKIICNDMTTKQLNDLWVSLRTEQLDWVLGFLNAQGQIAIANVIIKSCHKDNVDVVLNDKALDREFALFKCLKTILNLKEGADEAVKSNSSRIIVSAITEGLLSLRISTRRLATELLIFLTQWDLPNGFNHVIQALDQGCKLSENSHLQARLISSKSRNSTLEPLASQDFDSSNDQVMKKLEQWLLVVEYTLDGRGKMGSLVGASDDFKNAGGENAILEYAYLTTLLMNQLCNTPKEIQQRSMIRSRLRTGGLPRIMKKLAALSYEKVDEQLRIFEDTTADDYNTILSSHVMNKEVDMKNPVSIVENLWNTYKGTDAEKHFTSLLQHLLLSSTKTNNIEDPTEPTKQLKLIDSLVTNISMTSVDLESSFNSAIQRLYDAMQTDEIARRAILENRDWVKRYEEMKAERDNLSQKLSNAQGGLVGQLQDELKQRDRILDKSQRVTSQLQSDLEDLKKKLLLSKHEHELELRKVLTSLNSKPQSAPPPLDVDQTKFPSPLKPERKLAIQKALQTKLQQTKKDINLESKRLGVSLEPNKRLRVLRSRMEDLENQARELEMTNFSNFQKEQPIVLEEAPIPIELTVEKPQDFKSKVEDQRLQKLAELRRNLAAIQRESNNVSKFNVEERINELFQDKKLAALERLKELENRYKGFGISFLPNDDQGATALGTEEEGKQQLTLDPKQLTNKIEELTTIVQELEQLKQDVDNENENTHGSRGSSESQENTDEELEGSEGNLPDVDVPPTGSFLASLSQKYGTGQKKAIDERRVSYGRDNNYPGSGYHRKSFMNRVKKSGNASFIGELTEKVSGSQLESKGNTQLTSFNDNTEHTVGIGIMVGDKNQFLSSSRTAGDRKTTNKADKNTDTISQSTGNDVNPSATPSAPPPLPESLLHGTSNNSERASTASNVPAAPPPAPPVPAFLNSGKEKKTNKEADKKVEATTASTDVGPFSPPPPPPPPLPPSLSQPSKTETAAPPPPPPPPPPPAASFIGSGPAPPAPPPAPLMNFSKTNYRSATPSPLLPQSPSLFEKYPRPSKKLKQLHWEKIDDTEDSIWQNAKAEKFADDLYEKGILFKLEQAFAAREIKSFASKRKADSDKITFLSRDISQQFGINLHMYSSLSVNEVVMKILNCDRDFMTTPSVIEFLSKPEIVEVSNNLARNFAPYSTDWEGVGSVEEAKPPEKDPSELQRADRLYLEMMVNLQSYWSSRMRALRVATTYEKDHNDLVSKLRSIDKAVCAIQQSENLRNIFDVILAVGNYMNDPSKQAQGFRLTTLQRLTFIKDEKNSMTFLNYVEKIVREAYPEFNNFLKELEPVLAVTKVSIEQVSQDCKQYSQDIINVERSVDIGNLSDSSKFHPADKVLVKVLPALPEARRKGDLLMDEMKLTLLEFDNLMKLFGEDSTDKFARNSFFKKFADFLNEYKKAQAFNMKTEEEERLYQKRREMIEEQQRKNVEEQVSRSSSDQSEGVDPDYTGERDVMDRLLEKLKQAGPGKSDPSSARKRAMARKKLLNGSAGANILDNFEVEGVDTGSLVYSPQPDEKLEISDTDASPTPKSKSRSNINILPSGQEESVDLTDRARSLLQELRSPESLESKKTNYNERLSKLRARRRNAGGDTSSGKRLTFVSAGKPDDDVSSLDEATTNAELSETKSSENTTNNHQMGENKPDSMNQDDFNDSDDKSKVEPTSQTDSGSTEKDEDEDNDANEDDDADDDDDSDIFLDA